MKNLNKVTKLMSTVAVGAMVWGTTAYAAPVTDPLTGAFGTGGLKSLDLASIVTIAFQLLLAAAILWVVYNIVMAGIKIAGAKEDADKRKEGLKSIINAAIGLIVALSAFAIVTVVRNQLLNDNSNASIGTPCLKPDGTAGYINSQTKVCE